MRRLEARSVRATALRAPRLNNSPHGAAFAWVDNPAVDALARAFDRYDVVINCAGDPDASSQDASRLFGANAALPGIAAAAARQAGVQRFIHVSSAVVQGSAARLDASDQCAGTSTYAQSKIAGEAAVRAAGQLGSYTIYRPPSVHSAERRVTRAIGRVARSPLASVAGRGDAPTPQAHIDNVGDAIAELALTTEQPPTVVVHPWEGWTTAELMRAFGRGREPHHIPETLAGGLRRLLHLVGRVPQLAPNARRVEMMWFGQGQAESWLTHHGWVPVVGREGWLRTIAESANLGKTEPRQKATQ
ncbi:NAD-dependent epimerase/dehydratase family protein [Janibacter terrae]|uniref:NAD-dependent epimerase/dehydratase family protein n=1 Tax=Janibacter terrae TaxID=103817 RepID=UPI003BAFE5D9